MDFFLQPLVLLLIILVVSICVLHQRKLDGTRNLPPGSFGWPLVGETLRFLIFKKLEDFVQERQKKYASNVFKTNILGEPTVILAGPGTNKFIPMNEPKLVKPWYLKTQRQLFNLPEATKKQSPHQGVPKKGAAAAAKILGFLKPEGLLRYMGRNIECIIQQHFTTHWEGKNVVRVFPIMKNFVLTLIFQFYLGLDDPDHVAKFVSKFDDLHHGIYCVPVNLPGTIYRGALEAAAGIREEIQFRIREKVDGLNKGLDMEDVVARIIAAEVDGKYVPEMEISDIIMGLMNASYTSVATTLAFMIKHIGQNPDIYQKVVCELADITKSRGSCAAFDWDCIQKMKYTWAVAQETMRLYPTAPGSFREAAADITYDSFTIPKGWKIFWAISATNKDPMYFPYPEKFDPSRFEGDGPAPYTYIPFGSGPRTCPGKDYTRFVILTFIHKLITKFKWEVVLPDEKISGVMLPVPAEGLPIRLQQL